MLNLFIAHLSHDIDYLLINRLDHVVSLKSKWKSNWNYIENRNHMKIKLWLQKHFQTKSLILLCPVSAMAMVSVF